MKLYLIRHAQSTANVRYALDTALPGPPLTELGQRQASELAHTLRAEPILAVYSSQATRARQTGEPLAASHEMDVQVIDGVQEVFVGDLEGATDQESIQRYVDTVHPWTQGELGGSMPGGESGVQVRERFLPAVAELRAKHADEPADGVVALISHGGAIRLGAEWLADNVQPDVADSGLLPNTAMVVLESTSERGWTCLSWGDLVL